MNTFRSISRQAARRLVTAIALGATLLATVAASPASAGVEYTRGTYGYMSPGTATCRYDGIRVAGPTIKPSIPLSSGLTLGGSQLTAFVAILERHDPTRGWVDVYHTSSQPFYHRATWHEQGDWTEYIFFHERVGWTTTNAGPLIPMTYQTTDDRWLPLPNRVGFFRVSILVGWYDRNHQLIGEARRVVEGMGDHRSVDDRLWTYRHHCRYG